LLKTFDIVIVNWNSGIQLKDCVESIMNSLYDNCILNKIVVVDNDSKDDSLRLVEKLNYEKLEIIKNQSNLGFGKACNIGAKKSSSDFILFLNPDAMVYKDTFQKLFEYINKNDTKNVAVYGVQLLGEGEKIQKTCARFPTLSTFIFRSLGLNKLNSEMFKSYTMENWDHFHSRVVDQVMGAFFLVKRKIFEQLNGFDDRYFVYFEEVDFSKRLRDNNFYSLYVTEAQAYHAGGGASKQVKAFRLFFSLRSRLLYGFKHFSRWQAWLFVMLTCGVEPFVRISYSIVRRDWPAIKNTLKAYCMLWMGMNKIVRGVGRFEP